MGRILDECISPGFAFHWAGLMEEIIEFGDFPVAREELDEGVSDKDAAGRREEGKWSVHWIEEGEESLTGQI